MTTKIVSNHKRVPKLRFPEFKDAPEWEDTTIGDEATILKGKGVSKADLDTNGSQPCIRYGELYTRYGEVIDEVFSRTSKPAADLFLSRQNDVIIPSSGETKTDIATASCVMREKVALGGDLNVIRSKVNGVFLSYYLNGPKRFDIARVAQGDTVVHLYPRQLQQVGVSLPTPAEQQRIADCLSSLDEWIAAEAKRLDALKDHKKGLMQQLFPAEGETTPKLRFPEFQNAPEWKVKKLINVADKEIKWSFIGGPFGSNLKASDYRNEGVRIIQLQNIGDTVFLNDYKIYTSGRKADELLSCNIYPGDIILSKMGDPVARACVIPDHHPRYVMCSDGIRLAVDEKRYDKYFIYLYINSEVFRKRAERASTGSTRKRIALDALKQLPLNIPSLPEQQRIADCLSSLDEWIAAEAKRLEALKDHKKALMQQLFPSGEEADA